MTKAKVTKTEIKPRGTVGTDEILRSAKADNIFTVKAFVNRFKYKIGKDHDQNGLYYRTAKKLTQQFEKNELKTDGIVFPTLAFEVLRHKK